MRLGEDCRKRRSQHNSLVDIKLSAKCGFPAVPNMQYYNSTRDAMQVSVYQGLPACFPALAPVLLRLVKHF